MACPGSLLRSVHPPELRTSYGRGASFGASAVKSQVRRLEADKRGERTIAEGECEYDRVTLAGVAKILDVV
jgi:hypothetical protein